MRRANKDANKDADKHTDLDAHHDTDADAKRDTDIDPDIDTNTSTARGAGDRISDLVAIHPDGFRPVSAGSSGAGVATTSTAKSLTALSCWTDGGSS